MPSTLLILTLCLLPLASAQITCANVRCPSNTSCIVTPSGPVCQPAATCASTLCSTDTPICVETPSGPECRPRPACLCTAEFQPVCCRARGDVATESNTCTCTCAGGEVLSQGACPAGTPAPTPGVCPCPRVLRPVCCSLGGGEVTRSNACICECAGGTVEAEGECGVPKLTCANALCPVSKPRCVETENGPECREVEPACD